MVSVGRRIVFPARGQIAVESFAVPEPGPRQALVRTLRTAVSAGTELTGLLGSHPRARFPVYPGYSHVGVIEAVGEGVEGVQVGDRVLSMGRHQSHVLLDLAPDRPGGPDYLEIVPDGLSTRRSRSSAACRCTASARPSSRSGRPWR